MTTPTAAGVEDQAEQIRADVAAAYDRVRTNPTLTDQAKRIAIAGLFETAQQQMSNLQQKTNDNVARKVQAATTAAFGIDDIASPSSANRASVSLSYRDAQDRAAQLDSPRDGLALLARATASGDELLARAVFGQAWAQAGNDPGWNAVIDQYVASRPAAGRAVDALVNLGQQPGGILTPNGVGVLSLGAFFGWIVPTPFELLGMSSYSISALAAE